MCLEIEGMYPYRVETDEGSFITFAKNRETALRDVREYLIDTGERLVYIGLATMRDLIQFDGLHDHDEVPLNMDA